MAKTIKMSTDHWSAIRKRLKNEYQWDSIMLAQSVCHEELGFTVRNYTGFVVIDGLQDNYDCSYDKWVEEIHLDFRDDEKETFFRLKYL